MGQYDKKKSDQIQVQGNNLGKIPNLNPLLELGQAPRVQIMGLFRVTLALRLRIISDFTVSSCFGHIQSITIGKKVFKNNYAVIDPM